MKAIVYRRYGGPDVLHLEELATPVPQDNEILVKIRAASVNPLDWHFMRGTPYAVHLVAGLSRPRITSLGVDFAGCVEATGKHVTAFKTGDEVFGGCRGAFAEYACTTESKLSLRPGNITPEQAASVPIAACTALQGLRNKGRIRSGHTVLINGAAGGVGTFAVQIARSYGAEITAVCSTRNVDLVRSLGADRVIDYTQQDFTARPERYDLILDLVGNHSLTACRRVLNPNGIHVGAGGTTDNWMIGPIATALGSLVLSQFGSRKLVGLLAGIQQHDLGFLRDLMTAGSLTPVIDRSYPLDQVPEAIRYLELGHARGKVVINVCQV